MAQTYIKILNENGSLEVKPSGDYSQYTQKTFIGSEKLLTLESAGGMLFHTSTGNTTIINDTGNLSLHSLSNNNIVIDAYNPLSNGGGILLHSGTSGITGNSLGNIALYSNSNVLINANSNIIMNALLDVDITTANYNLIASDVINIVSNTGDINIGSDPLNPVIRFSDGNLLINQLSSIYDRQVDIKLSDADITKPYYNGIILNSSNIAVAADIELRTGNSAIFSLGIQPTSSNASVNRSILAYQTGDAVVVVSGDDFTSSDIGKSIYWTESNIRGIIVGLSYDILFSDPTFILITGTYTQSYSTIYLVEIDSIAVDNPTFKWSSDGGATYAARFIQCTTSATLLNNGLSITFADISSLTYQQRFLFNVKITAITETPNLITIPEICSILQSNYAYITTTTPSDIVISTNNTEKMRITGDGACGIGTSHPNSVLHLKSNYKTVKQVNHISGGIQNNPNITNMPNGGHIITWMSNTDIYGQRYQSDGSTYGDNFIISSNTSGGQIYPAIAANRIYSNSYIAVWSSNSAAAEYDVYCRIFRDVNTPISAEILVNEVTLPNSQIYPRVTGIENGNYVITWSNATGHTGNVYAAIISNNGTFIKSQYRINDVHTYSVNYPWVTGLPPADVGWSNGFVISYLIETDMSDDRYNIAYKLYTGDGLTASSETLLSHGGIIGLSDGLQSMDYLDTGGFAITYYQNYNTNKLYYNDGDNFRGLSSGIVGILNNPQSVSDSHILPVKGLSGKLMIGEEIEIATSVGGISGGIIIEKIGDITYLSSTTANITLDAGHRNIIMSRYATDTSTPIYNIIVNTNKIYDDTTADSDIRNIVAIAVDSHNAGLITWMNGSVPNIYYKIVDMITGDAITNEVRLLDSGLIQRNPMTTYLSSINGDDYGFVLTWDNANLDLSQSGIFQYILGYKHDLLRIDNGEQSALIIADDGNIGYGTTTPNTAIHLLQQRNIGASHTCINIQSNYDTITVGERFANTDATAMMADALVPMASSYNPLITDDRYVRTGLEFSNRDGRIQGYIYGGDSGNNQNLEPRADNLIGYYPMDDVDVSVLNNYAAGNNDGVHYSKFYMQTTNLETLYQRGKINNCIMLDGVSSHAIYYSQNYVQYNTLAISSNMTITAWIKIPQFISPTADRHYSIISNGDDFTVGGRYEFYIYDSGDDGNMDLYYRAACNPSMNILMSSAGTGVGWLNDDIWHHVCVSSAHLTSSNTRIRLYVDSVLAATAYMDGTYSSAALVQSDSVYLGSTTGADHYYRGMLDELRIYNEELTPAEVERLGMCGGGMMMIGVGAIDNTIRGATAITVDDTGAINNITAKSRNVHVIPNKLTLSKSNVIVTTTDSSELMDVNIGDILRLYNGVTLADYAVLGRNSTSNVVVDRPTYDGIGTTGYYTAAMCYPAIQRWCNQDNLLVASLDYRGNMLLGNGGGLASGLLELVSASQPNITLSNTAAAVDNGGSLSALRFRGNTSAGIYEILGAIEVSRDVSATAADSFGHLVVKLNATEDNVMTITANGYMAIGDENNPITRLHIRESDSIVPARILIEANYGGGGGASAVFGEAGEIYWGGQYSMTETNSIASNTLVKISGSNDGVLSKPDGRFDIYTNDSDFPLNGLENRMSITHTGAVGIGIVRPENRCEISAEHRNSAMELNYVVASSNVSATTEIQLSNNIFSGGVISDEDKIRLIGGALIVYDKYLSRYNISEIINASNLRIDGNYADSGIVVGQRIAVNYAGLNVTTSNACIGLGIGNPTSAVTMNGGVAYSIVTVTVDIVLNNSHYTVLCDDTAAVINITLPDCVGCVGRVYVIKKVSNVNNVAIIPSGGQLIDGLSGYALNTQYKWVMIQSDGIGWWIISN